jgi:hypothetical protein
MQLKKFAVFASSILQRNPVVMRPLSAIEREYQIYRESLEEERARGHFNIAKPDGNNAPTSITTVEAPSFEVQLNEDLPVADVKRHLHRKLYFAFRNAITGSWQLPSGLISPGNALPQDGLHVLAQQALVKLFAPSNGLQLYHVGAAPVACFHESFADRVEPPLGAKHFFFRTQLLAGKLRLSEASEFGWFVREELKERLHEKYYTALEPVLSE